MREDMEHVPPRVVVRPEGPDDNDAVYRVSELAFGRRDEADLVDRLRAAGKAIVSLVAADAGRIVGHILFSPVSVKSSGADCSAVGLAPMAVLPNRQRQGIGSFLVRRGHYGRFGFLPASRFGIRCEYDAPEEAFMVMELRPGALNGCAGTAVYAPEFGGLE
jgi:putative acetyltransferase